MYLIAIAWIYVVLMMAIAEATGTGTVLGAIFTFVLYGLLPLSIVLYIGGAPARRAARRRTELSATAAEVADAPPVVAPVVTAGGTRVDGAGRESAPDGGGHAAGRAVAPEREEP